MAQVQELQWGESDVSNLLPLDVVLVADCTYDESYLPDLMTALRALCEDSTKVFLSMDMRCEETHVAVLTAVLEVFEVIRLPLSSQHPDFTSSRCLIYVLALAGNTRNSETRCNS